MIIFLHDASHLYTHRALCKHPDLPDIRCHSYDWLLKQRRLPEATYIFTDRERMDLWQIRILQHYYKHINEQGDGFFAINNPGQMMNRRILLRSLYHQGINPFNVYAVTERQQPERFPVFIRNEHDHSLPLTGLLHSQKELEIALSDLTGQGLPEDGLLITEYCAEPLEGELFRKLSSYKVGDQLFFYNTVHQQGWHVKDGTLNSATQAMYEDELAMISQNAYQEQLSRIFEIADIDYGRADFGIADGKVVLYEINTNPHTRAPNKPHPNLTRQQSMKLGWQKYSEALQKLDRPGNGKTVEAPDDIPGLQRKSRRLSFLPRVRIRR